MAAKYLVTGATGFVGRHVVAQLLQAGDQVVVTSRDRAKAQCLPWFDEVTYVQSDLGVERDDWHAFFGHPTCAIHLAWHGLPHYNESFHCECNLPQNYTFLKNLLASGLPHLLVAGTCLEYGMVEGCLREDLDTNPHIPYAQAKDQLRRSIEQLEEGGDFIFQWVRLFYLYGEGQSPHSLIPQLQAALDSGARQFPMSGGEQLRDFLPVQQAADYLVRIARQEAVQGCINCCSGTPISVRRLVEDFLAERGASIELNLGHYPYPTYEPMAFWGDTQKLHRVLELQ